ncbi:hypothetical protein [Thalassotalea maritima]|uniref:hypothetical protein n=1 Tax=Thalassotalea maritima TaxID=3242416 RepID=UPI0035286F1B
MSLLLFLVLVLLQQPLPMGSYVLDQQGCLTISPWHHYQLLTASRVLPFALCLVVNERIKFVGPREPESASSTPNAMVWGAKQRRYQTIKKRYFLLSKTAMATQDYRRLARVIVRLSMAPDDKLRHE